MLKIKDNIDLKELEKYEELECMIPEVYGFNMKYENTYTDKKCIYSTDREDLYCELDIMEDGEIRASCYLDLIYDLIKDGLVEKVEDK